MNFISKDFSDNIPWQKLNFRQVFSFYSAHHWSSLPLIKFNNNRTCWYGLRLRCSTCLAPFQLKKKSETTTFEPPEFCWIHVVGKNEKLESSKWKDTSPYELKLVQNWPNHLFTKVFRRVLPPLSYAKIISSVSKQKLWSTGDPQIWRIFGFQEPYFDLKAKVYK